MCIAKREREEKNGFLGNAHEGWKRIFRGDDACVCGIVDTCGKRRAINFAFCIVPGGARVWNEMRAPVYLCV